MACCTNWAWTTRVSWACCCSVSVKAMRTRPEERCVQPAVRAHGLAEAGLQTAIGVASGRVHCVVVGAACLQLRGAARASSRGQACRPDRTEASGARIRARHGPTLPDAGTAGPGGRVAGAVRGRGCRSRPTRSSVGPSPRTGCDLLAFELDVGAACRGCGHFCCEVAVGSLVERHGAMASLDIRGIERPSLGGRLAGPGTCWCDAYGRTGAGHCQAVSGAVKRLQSLLIRSPVPMSTFTDC
jgi:hypothetical protein